MQNIMDKLPDWTLRLFWPAAWPYFVLKTDSIFIGIVLGAYVIFRFIKWFRKIDSPKESASERFERVRQRIEAEEKKKKEGLDWVWLALFLTFVGMVALSYLQLSEEISSPFSLATLVYLASFTGVIVVLWDVRKDLIRMNELNNEERAYQGAAHNVRKRTP